mmetsp:Transcript_4364/g.5038  ORF Transcript_4364/g.5038 Transcript_4364/m.5038 type:complete len:756 (-) Transcript_4364:206-2473(-)
MMNNSNQTALPMITRRGTYRHKYRTRAWFQSIALILLVSGYTVYYSFVPEATRPENWFLNSSTSRAKHFKRNLSSSIQIDDNNSNPNVIFVENESNHNKDSDYEIHAADSSSGVLRFLQDKCNNRDPAWLIVFDIFALLYMFLALAIVCDEFFVPALEEMSSERHLNLSMDVAGATLMAAGGSAPELFTNFFSTFQESDLGIGTIVGSAVFNVMFVIGMCSLLAKDVLTLTWWPLFRDATFYAISLIVLTVMIGVWSPGEIDWVESVVLLVLYLVYCTFMYYNQRIYKALTGKELEYPEEPDDEDDDEDGDEEDKERPSTGNAETTNNGTERPILVKKGSQRSVVSTHSFLMTEQPQTTIHLRWQNTFRAGILKLLRDPDSWLDTAGVGLVAKIAGDVNEVFKVIDMNGDGSIDRDELERLFEKLECHLSPHELDEVFAQLDSNGDKLICGDEFSTWYIRSEERILSRVKHIFDSFDVNNSQTIDRAELKLLMGKLEPRVTDKDVDDAINQMYQSGSRDEVTFDEFSVWYKQSIIYKRQIKAVEDDMQGVFQNVRPPIGEGWFTWLKWLVVLPLVLVMTVTIPDVQRPNMHRWCYFSFAMSIVWIGCFSSIMVYSAENFGGTVGIPDFIMGITLVAAGTSVPDLLSSVIVARRGYGDMAVSSSIGSNIFDILVGLPVPWLIFQLYPNNIDIITISSEGLFRNILILIGMLCFVIVSIHFQNWKLTKLLGGFMFLFYFAFLAQAIMFGLKDLVKCT